MNMKILNCGECPLRRGKYMCLGLDRMKDAEGIKRHITTGNRSGAPCR